MKLQEDKEGSGIQNRSLPVNMIQQGVAASGKDPRTDGNKLGKEKTNDSPGGADASSSPTRESGGVPTSRGIAKMNLKKQLSTDDEESAKSKTGYSFTTKAEMEMEPGYDLSAPEPMSDPMDLPQTDELYTETKRQEAKQKKRTALLKMMGGFLCIFVIITVVVLLVVFLDEKNNEDASTSIGIKGAPALTTAPSLAPATHEDDVLDLLPELSVEAISNGETPQFKAYQWLVHNDTLFADGELTNERILQRFALATFFYSTGGEEEWLNKTDWLTDKHECDWYFGGYYEHVLYRGFN